MKLKTDCIRDVMIEIEKRHKITVDDDNNITFEDLWIEDLYDAMPKHSKEDIFYAVHNLAQANYLNVGLSDGDDSVVSCVINYMTYEGHNFLEKIRDPRAWKYVKGAGTAIGNMSLAVINQVANGITTALIDAHISKNGIEL